MGRIIARGFKPLAERETKMKINLNTGEVSMNELEARKFYELIVAKNGNPSTSDFINTFGNKDGNKLFLIYLSKFANKPSGLIASCANTILEGMEEK